MKRKVKIGAATVMAAVACVLAACCSAPLNIVGFAATAEIHTDKQAAYLSGDYRNIREYASANGEFGRPQGVKFEWTGGRGPYELCVYPDGQPESARIYRSDRAETTVYNLEIGGRYVWNVKSNGGEISETSSFSVSDSAPRNLYIDGITNARDLGGWRTENGGRVKQGKIIRCGRLNKSNVSTPEIEITDSGIEELVDRFGVKSEVDLRRENERGGITSSPLGDRVNYVNIPMGLVSGENFDYLTDERFFPPIRAFFEFASDENNYPFIFHCNIGTDRTGLFAFLINGLLGVSEDDLYRDYLFSNFGDIEGYVRSPDNISPYVARIKSFAGDTLSEKIENCLIDIGVNKSHIDSLVGIMTENIR